MIKYLIIEDEPLAFEELKRMVEKLRPEFQMSGWSQSVAQSISLLKSQSFDLIFADISLADGLCFDIFNEIPVNVPVIFTTAYDEYAIKAFKVNGIDYLLKPIEQEELEHAILRFERNNVKTAAAEVLSAMDIQYSNCPRTRFMVKTGDSFFHVEAFDIAFFYSEDKYTYLHLFSSKRFVMDYSLDTIEGMLDRKLFYRISRGCIVNIRAIEKCCRYLGGRLKLHCTPQLPIENLVSRGRVKTFLEWFDGII